MAFVIKYMFFAGLTLGAAAIVPAKWQLSGWRGVLGMLAWFLAGGLIFLS